LKTARSARRLEVPAVLVERLRALKGEDPAARVFGDVDRHWLAYHVHRIAKVARGPDVSPHGLRGTWATLAVSALPTEHVAAALGHRPEVTRGSYAQPGAEQSRNAGTVWETLGSEKFPGGESPSKKDSN
jgi:integrase